LIQSSAIMDSTSSSSAPYCCSIIPVSMLKAIANSKTASSNSRDVANKTIKHIQAMHNARVDTHDKLAAGESHPPRRGFVPQYVFQSILDSDTASEQAKEQAHHHLASMDSLKAAKTLPVDKKPLAKPTTPVTPAMHLFRVLYTSHGTDVEPGKLIFKEGKIPAKVDPAAKQVYDQFGDTFKFYSEVLSRNSIDNKGMNLIGSVHYDDDNGRTPGYDNAFWDGKQMCFGDGDPEIFNTFTGNVDITGHELTHGVTEHTANLAYEYQSGALNESISDCFGSMVKQYTLKQKAKEADWLIGQGLLRDPKARALRDMANPGTAYVNIEFIDSDPQPKDMDGWVDAPNTTDGDFGGVHTNSGIPNRAFYLAATSIGTYSWDPVGKIWYAALSDPALKKVDTKKTFSVFADLTIKHAKVIGGDAAVTAVKNAWEVVKVLKPAIAGTPSAEAN